MRLQISHRTVFRFSQPKRYVVQSHRLQPAEFDSQRVIDWRVEVEGASFGMFHTDGAGDKVRSMTIDGPTEEVAVEVSGLVEASDTSGVLRGHAETISPLVYLRDTDLTEPDDALRALAAKATGDTSLDIAHSLSALVAEAVTYEGGRTAPHTTAAEALSEGHGVCQDHAHVLIATARLLGMPARYVSGYLHATEEDISHEAGHAWAEINVPGLGWVGFDPSNKCCPNENYVRLGSGLDALHAAPIRGVTMGAGEETLDVSVAVGAAQQ